MPISTYSYKTHNVKCLVSENKNVAQIVLLFAQSLDFLYEYINVSQFFWLFVYKKMGTLSFDEEIHCHLHLYINNLFWRDLFIYTKSKIYISFLRKEFF